MKLATKKQVIRVTETLLLRAHDLISRRQLLLAAASAVLLPGGVSASSNTSKKISWSEFESQMAGLASSKASGRIDQKVVAEHGMQYLKQLDIRSEEFKMAVNESYETGNRYWLWQRMIKQKNINGGILNIDSEQIVQLHDHPGATGVVRIISGETEVWLFDEDKKSKAGGGQGAVELVRVSRRILRAGDTAVLTPNKGNIHALRSVSKECRMLDFFIPPYERSQRNWFEPLEKNWFDKEKIACKKIPQHAYTNA
jgi:hypothetical protein